MEGFEIAHYIKTGKEIHLIVTKQCEHSKCGQGAVIFEWQGRPVNPTGPAVYVEFPAMYCPECGRLCSPPAKMSAIKWMAEVSKHIDKVRREQENPYLPPYKHSSNHCKNREAPPPNAEETEQRRQANYGSILGNDKRPSTIDRWPQKKTA